MDDNGAAQEINSEDVNAYLRDIMGDEFTAKDFRTWAGTLLASEYLRGHGPCRTKGELNRTVKQTVKAVAEKLGNTPAVCRKSYIHPVMLELAGRANFDRSVQTASKGNRTLPRGLRADEVALVALLSARDTQLVRMKAPRVHCSQDFCRAIFVVPNTSNIE